MIKKTESSRGFSSLRQLLIAEIYNCSYVSVIVFLFFFLFICTNLFTEAYKISWSVPILLLIIRIKIDLYRTYIRTLPGISIKTPNRYNYYKTLTNPTSFRILLHKAILIEKKMNLNEVTDL